MASDYVCPQCGSREWTRREVIHLNSAGKVNDVADSGVFQCGGCACRILIDVRTREIARVETSARRTSAQRSSKVVSSASEREGQIDRREF